MQKWKEYYISYLFLIGFFAVVVAGCGSSTDIMKGQTDTELFEQGEQYYNQGEYKKSLEYFLYVKDHFLRSPYAGSTRFYAGESYFGLEKYADAVIEYKSFLSFFPDDPNAVVAQYKLGVSHLKQTLGPDRDQTMIQKALTELQKVRENYPDNAEYVQKAEEQLKITKDKLALHEFVVAEVYRKEKLYSASNRRLNYLMKEYPESHLVGDALFTLGQNYLAMDQPDDAKDPFLRLLRNYSNHQSAPEARQQLAKLGITNIPETASQPASEQIADISPPETSSSDLPVPPAQPDGFPEGYVVLKRDNFVFTDLIRDDGIQEGMVLEVHRKTELIGTIRIIEVQEGFSIGEVESLQPNMTIYEEDTVCCPSAE